MRPAYAPCPSPEPPYASGASCGPSGLPRCERCAGHPDGRRVTARAPRGVGWRIRPLPTALRSRDAAAGHGDRNPSTASHELDVRTQPALPYGAVLRHAPSIAARAHVARAGQWRSGAVPLGVGGWEDDSRTQLHRSQARPPNRSLLTRTLFAETPMAGHEIPEPADRKQVADPGSDLRSGRKRHATSCDPAFRHGVVVGFDGSMSSERALAYAIGMAHRLGSGLIIVHVANRLPTTVWAGCEPPGLRGRARPPHRGPRPGAGLRRLSHRGALDPRRARRRHLPRAGGGRPGVLGRRDRRRLDARHRGRIFGSVAGGWRAAPSARSSSSLTLGRPARCSGSRPPAHSLPRGRHVRRVRCAPSGRLRYARRQTSRPAGGGDASRGGASRRMGAPGTVSRFRARTVAARSRRSDVPAARSTPR